MAEIDPTLDKIFHMNNHYDTCKVKYCSQKMLSLEEKN